MGPTPILEKAGKSELGERSTQVSDVRKVGVNERSTESQHATNLPKNRGALAILRMPFLDVV